MGQHSSSLLPRVPAEVLDNIVVLAVDDLGPPQELARVLRVCKHTCLNINLNNVGARIFRCKFDVSAPERRLPEAAMFPSSLFRQLQDYCTTLHVVRDRDIFNPHIEDHLWNVYFMLSENDGMNAMQLIHWANVRVFIDNFVRRRLHEGKDAQDNWPLDNAVNSLALWIMWMSLDDDEVTNETLARRSELQELVRPYVINMVRYPVFHVPDNHYNVPIDRMYMGQFPHTNMTAHGPYPPYRDAHAVTVQREHFSRDITLMPPLISTAARLLYFSRSEAFGVLSGDHVPQDRQHALALGHDWVHPTRTDWAEFNAVRAARAPERGLLDPHTRLDPTAMDLNSIHFDACYQRLVDCTDPFWVNLTAPYEFGSLTGDFSGRMLIPETSEANRMLNSPVYEAGKPAMTVTPLFARLQEWQCVNPQQPIPEGGQGSYLWDEGIRNGWFPEVVFHINNDVIKVHDRHDAGIVYRYEMFVPGRPNSHDPSTCSSCAKRALLATQAEEERVRKIRSREALQVDAGLPTEGETHPSSGLASDPPPPRPAPTPLPADLLPPRDVLEPQFLKARIEESLGEGVNIDEMLEEELADTERVDVGEVDTDDEQADGSDDLLRDLSPFEREPCTGVRDVIITGQTLPRHAEAWHNYVFYGRVRAYDGLIALVRKPIVFHDFGIQIFRGYLVSGTTLVGNWRSYRQNAAELAQEGPFIVRRNDFSE